MAIPTPASTCLSLPRRTRPARARGARPCGQTLARRGTGAAYGRRFGGLGTPPDLRYTAGAAGAARTAQVRCLPSIINGGGSAAAMLNQRKRLRRSSKRGSGGRCQHGRQPQSGCLGAPVAASYGLSCAVKYASNALRGHRSAAAESTRILSSRPQIVIYTWGWLERGCSGDGSADTTGSIGGVPMPLVGGSGRTLGVGCGLGRCCGDVPAWPGWPYSELAMAQESFAE